MWASAPVRAPRVTDDPIVFQVPPGAASGLIAARAGRGRDLAVGTARHHMGYLEGAIEAGERAEAHARAAAATDPSPA